MATISFLYRSIKANSALTVHLTYVSKEHQRKISAKTRIFVDRYYWEEQHFEKIKNDVVLENFQLDTKKKLLELKTYLQNLLNDLDPISQASKTWIKKAIDDYYTPKKELEKKLYVNYWINEIIDTANIRENAKGGIGLSKSRINSYNSFLKIFSEYQGSRNLKIKDLSKNEFEDFKKWLFNDKKYLATTSIKRLTDLMGIVKEAKKNGIAPASDFENVRFKKVTAYDEDMDVITLTLKDIEKIEKAKLVSNPLINARKWLIISIFTGQRGQDLTTRIHKDNFKRYNNDYIISYKQEKGNKKVTIPVLPKVKAIYESGLPYPLATQHLNKYFKAICKIAEINNLVMGILRDPKTNRGVKKLRPKYMYIGTHTGRRSFATIHYGKLPTPLIMKVTGHKKESTLMGYINKSSNDHIDAFFDLYNKKEDKKAVMNIVKKASNLD